MIEFDQVNDICCEMSLFIIVEVKNPFQMYPNNTQMMNTYKCLIISYK